MLRRTPQKRNGLVRQKRRNIDGQTRHEKRHFAIFAYEMLECRRKVDELLEIGVDFIDSDEKADGVLCKHIENAAHARTPIARIRVTVFPRCTE